VNIYWKTRRTVVKMPYMTQGAVPAMKLVVHHAPHQRIEVLVDGKFPFLVPLADLEWDHASLSKLNKSHLQEVDIGEGWDANGGYMPETGRAR
jgi:hypothetical protein